MKEVRGNENTVDKNTGPKKTQARERNRLLYLMLQV